MLLFRGPGRPSRRLAVGGPRVEGGVGTYRRTLARDLLWDFLGRRMAGNWFIYQAVKGVEILEI